MYKNIVLFILLPLLLMTVPIQAIEVIFRYDDLKLTPSEIDKRVVALFGEKNVPLSIAVIPCNSSEMPIPAADSALLSALRGGGAMRSPYMVLRTAIASLEHLKKRKLFAVFIKENVYCKKRPASE